MRYLITIVCLFYFDCLNLRLSELNINFLLSCIGTYIYRNDAQTHHVIKYNPAIRLQSTKEEYKQVFKWISKILFYNQKLLAFLNSYLWRFVLWTKNEKYLLLLRITLKRKTTNLLNGNINDTRIALAQVTIAKAKTNVRNTMKRG